MGYVAAAWLVTGLLLGAYGWSIRQRRRAVRAEAAETADAVGPAADGGRFDATGAVVETRSAAVSETALDTDLATSSETPGESPRRT